MGGFEKTGIRNSDNGTAKIFDVDNCKHGRAVRDGSGWFGTIANLQIMIYTQHGYENERNASFGKTRKNNTKIHAWPDLFATGGSPSLRWPRCCQCRYSTFAELRYWLAANQANRQSIAPQPPRILSGKTLPVE
ncbi:MAG: hypothetical protein LBH06_01055 [Rikenellaceae bacterium]|jgi:hypothetical protein|nr:hypothetical protein [Rikenellaceae bacterium]